MEHQPAVVCSTVQRLGQQCESSSGEGALNDFHVDAELGGMLDQVLTVVAMLSHRAGVGSD